MKYILFGSLVLIFLNGCQSQITDQSRDDLLDTWNKTVRQAVEKCSNKRGRIKARQVLARIKSKKLREKVIAILISENILTSNVSKVFLLEEYGGYSPTYIIYVRVDKKNDIYEMKYDRLNDKLSFNTISINDSMNYAVNEFAAWYDWYDWVKDHQKTYNCDSISVMEIVFRFDYTF